jgi:peptide/nickel transport system permease protein
MSTGPVRVSLSGLKAWSGPVLLWAGTLLTVVLLLVSVFNIGGIEELASQRDLERRLLPPGSDGHLLGTDGLGRDVLARVIVGTRYTFGIAAMATAIAGFLGIALGLLAAIGPRWLRDGVGRLVDMTIAFPSLVLAIVMVGVLGRGNITLAVALGLFYWPVFARVTLAQARGVAVMQYVTAAHLFGVSQARIVWSHILPGIAPTVSVVVAFQFASLLISTAGLSFLGLGPPLGVPEWGSMLAEARAELNRAPWLLLGPGIGIAWTVVMANLVGDALAKRSRFDKAGMSA